MPPHARRVVIARHHRFSAGRLDGLEDIPAVGCHDDASGFGFHSPPPDMHDHRQSVNIGERLARETRRLHASGNENESFLGHCERILLFG